MKISKFGNKKFCKDCKKTLSYKEFRLLKGTKGWKDFKGNHRYHQCKKCESIYSYKKYKKWPIARKLLASSNARCVINKSKNDLTYEIINKMLRETNGRCPSCKKKFNRTKEYMDMGVKKNWSTHSLDRINNLNRNYTVDNVRIICLRCNRIKSYWSLKDLENIVHYMKRD